MSKTLDKIEATPEQIQAVKETMMRIFYIGFGVGTLLGFILGKFIW
jgi:hypothetical protein